MNEFRIWLAKTMTFDGWMAISEVQDALRAWPRFWVTSYMFGSFYIIKWILQFYFDLPAAEKEVTQTALLCGAVITALTTTGAAVFAIYNNSARDWPSYHAQKKLQQAALLAGRIPPEILSPQQPTVTTTTRVETPPPAPLP